MTFSSVLKTFFSFRGGMTRKPYIIAMVINQILIAAIGITLMILGDIPETMVTAMDIIAVLFLVVAAFVVLWSWLAVMTKRIHEIGHSGWHLAWVVPGFFFLGVVAHTAVFFTSFYILLAIAPSKAPDTGTVQPI